MRLSSGSAESDSTSARSSRSLYLTSDSRSFMDDSSSIKNVPNEVLARIFSTVTNRRQAARELPSPILLSSVCRHWRILAQNTPELWINIVVPMHKSLEDCKNWTAEWIARSGVLLISVIIQVGIEWRVHLTNIISLLSQHSERLRRLALHCSDNCSDSPKAVLDSVFSQLKSAPNLQELTFDSQNYTSWWIQIANSSHGEYSLDFPRLNVLKMEGSIPPISNLTSLTIGKLYATYEAISHILTTSPGLQHLALYDLFPLPTTLPQDTPLIRADSLRSLAVNMQWTHHPRHTHIFKYLAMPNINYLELDGDRWSILDFGQSLSSAKIDTLRISNCSGKSFDANTIDFLHSLSTLRHLQLVNTSTQLLFKIKSPRNLAHRTSINFHSSSSLSRPTTPTDVDAILAIQQRRSVLASVWPALRIISLDTLIAADVVNLCKFITFHKHVEVVELSTSARRHLSSSLHRKDEIACERPSLSGRPHISSSLHRKDDIVYERPSLFMAVGSEEGLNDVEEWLGKMVDIRAHFRVGLLNDGLNLCAP